MPFFAASEAGIWQFSETSSQLTPPSSGESDANSVYIDDVGRFERDSRAAQKAWSSRAEPEVRIHLPPGESRVRTSRRLFWGEVLPGSSHRRPPVSLKYCGRQPESGWSARRPSVGSRRGSGAHSWPRGVKAPARRLVMPKRRQRHGPRLRPNLAEDCL